MKKPNPAKNRAGRKKEIKIILFYIPSCKREPRTKFFKFCAGQEKRGSLFGKKHNNLTCKRK
jgi:hypothetical protein